MRARIVEIWLLKGRRGVIHRLGAITGDDRNFANILILIGLHDNWCDELSLRYRGIDLLNVRHDVFFSERTLHAENGAPIGAAIDQLRDLGHVVNFRVCMLGIVWCEFFGHGILKRCFKELKIRS